MKPATIRAVVALSIWVLSLTLFILVTRYITDATWSWKLAVVLWLITLAYTVNKFYVVVEGNKVVVMEEQLFGAFAPYRQGFHILFPTEKVYKTVDLEKDVKVIAHSATYMSNNGSGIDVGVTIVCRPLYGNRPIGDKYQDADIIKYVGHKEGVIEMMVKAEVSQKLSSTFGVKTAANIISKQATLKADLGQMFDGLAKVHPFEENAGIWIGEITVTDIKLDADAKSAEMEKLKGQALAKIIKDLLALKKAGKLDVSDSEIFKIAQRQFKNLTTNEFIVNATGLDNMAHFSMGGIPLPFPGAGGGKGGGSEKKGGRP